MFAGVGSRRSIEVQQLETPHVLVGRYSSCSHDFSRGTSEFCHADKTKDRRGWVHKTFATLGAYIG